ncbi:MAG: thiamine pyrophosphate-dependent dehydrogenase E1 component subunit alpha, partial [Planctomycetes bacterium]|nr:thiamine pyrophosphate-dependent dehydrogenase E1 component subunit alpha [Planctomycetota bacterium]
MPKTVDPDVAAMTTIPQPPGDAIALPETSMRTNSIDLGEIEDLKILDEHGEVDEGLAPKIDDEQLLRIHRAMVLTRTLDLRMLAMQRQGEMGTFAPGLGQEATQIGQIYPLKTRDWFSPSYRSFGAQLWRGWTIEGLMLLWDGFTEGFEVPPGVNDLPFSIVVGSHVPMAVGVAMAITNRGDDAVMLANFGDGAISQGPVSEAFNFAAVYKAPVVFVCENNGYAISVPVERQAGIKELARRGPGFGIPAIRVDGNDVLAMIVATTRAVERARSGGGPTLIEAVTYRMSLHTTADDPKVYRSEDEVERWKPKCPIARFEKYLTGKGLLDPDAIERIAAECEQEVLDGRERFRARAKPRPRAVVDHRYETL